MRGGDREAKRRQRAQAAEVERRAQLHKTLCQAVRDVIQRNKLELARGRGENPIKHFEARVLGWLMGEANMTEAELQVLRGGDPGPYLHRGETEAEVRARVGAQ